MGEDPSNSFWNWKINLEGQSKFGFCLAKGQSKVLIIFSSSLIVPQRDLEKIYLLTVNVCLVFQWQCLKLGSLISQLIAVLKYQKSSQTRRVPINMYGSLTGTKSYSLPTVNCSHWFVFPKLFPSFFFSHHLSYLSPVQTDATLLANNSQNCWMLHVASVCTPCCMLLDVVAQSLKPVKLFSQQLPTFLLFCDRWSVTQQCWIRLHSSSNIVGATHAHYTWFTKTYGLYPSYDALQVPTLLGVVLSVCTPLP